MRTFRLVGVDQGGFDGGTTLFVNRWNERGELVRQELTRPDGTVEIIDLVYEEGRAVTGEEDIGVDGSVDSRRRYVYDGEGRLVLREVDADLDGDYERGFAWEIDERGLAVASWSPVGCEPEACPAEAREYSRFFYENGLLSRVEVDFREAPLDGEADRRFDFAYDDLGRAVSVTGTDLDDGGVASTSFRYEEGRCDTNLLNSRFTYFCVAAPAAPEVSPDR